MQQKIKIAIICGATATGKSRLAVDLAEKIGGEIINADSMQIYKGMEIASAAPLQEDKQRVPHHLFGFIEPDCPFSVAQWVNMAREKVAETASRGKMPVVVGGTGLYISALSENIVFDETRENPEFRTEMYKMAQLHGNRRVWEELYNVDAQAAESLHENNLKRVIRALESFRASGLSMASRLEKSRAVSSPYNAAIIGLDFEDRAQLYSRIDRRVDSMVENDLVEEARAFFERYYSKTSTRLTSAQALGHKELFDFFKNEKTFADCLENLKTKSRNYAKRQLTWFRKNHNIKWLRVNEDTIYDSLLKETIESVNIL